LRGQAAAYFCELVAFNQAKSALEQSHAYGRLRRVSRHRKAHKLDAAQDAYHSSWYLPAIRELVVHKDFQVDPAWIARKLQPAISTAEAARAIDTLIELGLLTRGPDGKLLQTELLLETRDGPLSYRVAGYHRTMMERAASALDSVPREDREIASLTLCLSAIQARELKHHLERFREEILHLYTSGSDASRVVQLNLQLFPLSKET
jgi:uncharacterized protein (TIGR02147 family)